MYIRQNGKIIKSYLGVGNNVAKPLRRFAPRARESFGKSKSFPLWALIIIILAIVVVGSFLVCFVKQKGKKHRFY